MTAFCFLLAELLLAASAADAGARAIGADADVGFAWSGRRRWCRRRSSAASYRVIANDRKFCSTDSGGALPRSLSAAAAAARKDQRNLAALTKRAVVTRARSSADSSALGQQTDLLDRLGPARRRCGCWPTSPVLFSGIVVGRFRGRTGADDGARAIGADADRLRLVGAAAMVPAPSAASYGVIANRSENLQH